MFKAVVLFSVLAFAKADVRDISRTTRQLPQQAYIVRLNSDIQANGYSYGYETSNGITAQENGQLVGRGGQEPSIAAQGSFAYTSPEGQPIALSYIADENGFQPQGAHLPTPPPIPAEIQRALEYIRTHPQPQQIQRIGF